MVAYIGGGEQLLGLCELIDCVFGDERWLIVCCRFSRRSILDFQSGILEKVKVFSRRINEFVESGEVLKYVNSMRALVLSLRLSRLLHVACICLFGATLTTHYLSVTEAFPAFTGDIIMEYFFGFSYKQLEHPKFDSFHEAIVAIGSTGHAAYQFPWFLSVSPFNFLRWSRC
jgi:hypothetical protein